MQPHCLICNSSDSAVVNVRNDDQLEGAILAEHPFLLDIPVNQPLNVCQGCLNKQGTDAPQQNDQECLPNTESLPFFSESVGGGVSNATSQSLPRFINLQDISNVDHLKRLYPDRPELVKNIHEVSKKAMPVAIKKRKVQEMLDNDHQLDVVLEPPQEEELPVMERLLRNKRTNRIHNNSSSGLSFSQSINGLSNSSTSLDSVAPVRAASESRIIPRTRTNPVNRTAATRQLPPPLPIAEMYQNDSDSSLEQQGRRTSTNDSTSSNDSQRNATVRRTDDGNNHSNLAAPRRVRVPDIQIPNTRGAGVSLKTINSG